jgi:bifunctional non-homologous end joining protein LigD
MPISWHELTPRLDPASFTVRTVPQRLARQRRDPWEAYFRTRQRLTRAVIEAVRSL